MDEQIEEIYFTKHPLECNCVNIKYQGWVIKVYEKDELSLTILTIDGKEI